MNKEIRTNKKTLAFLFAGVYLFAVLFSGLFHTHTNYSNEKFKNVKKAPVSNKIINFGSSDDCFSSHFFNAGIGILDSENNLRLIFLPISKHSEFFFKFSVSTKKIYCFSLRAPPFFI